MSTLAPPASTVLSHRDVQFLLHEWLKVEDLCARDRYAEHSREIFDDVIALAEQIATERFASHNSTADANEPRIGDDGKVVLIPEIGSALTTFAEAGFLGATLDSSVGGLQLPQVVGSAAMAFFQAANIATCTYPILTTAAANLLLAHGTREQHEQWVVPMVEGRYFGTMCLSEAQAGSSLGDITTRATLQDDGSYLVTGSKMWTSAGEHELSENIVHLVMAKIPGGPAGVKGISLVLVPRYLPGGADNGVVLVGLNHKLGFRGAVNTVLSFEGAKGWLVGEPHNGLAYMFHMMNEARVGVGLGAACTAYTGYLKSLRYARGRPQGRSPSAKDPAAPQVPITEHADVRRMLLAQKSYVEGALALCLYSARLVDDERTLPDEDARARAHLLLDVLTPITKSWPGQWCLEASSLAIQVHGGYGYTREYEVEQHFRDNRLNPIHEGTHGIHGLDLLGRKVTMQGGAGLRLLAETIDATVTRGRTSGGEAAVMADALDAAVDRLVQTTAMLWSQPDVKVALANASTYLEAAGHVVVAWIWLEQVLAAAGREGTFYDGKRAAARYFFRYELPKTGPQFDLLCALDRTTVELDPDLL
jgi:alkylation response protein AidB-like acyl-CoA dehydrogenase